MRFFIFLFSILTWAGSAMASEADALAISSNIQARHLPYAAILDPVYDSPDGNQIVSYGRCADSADP